MPDLGPWTNLLPKPVKIDLADGYSVFPPGAIFQVDGQQPSSLESIVSALNESPHADFGIRFSSAGGSGSGSLFRFWLGHAGCDIEQKAAGLPDEGYVLKIAPEGIVGVARTGQGLLWAAMTLRQLIEKHDGPTCVRCLEIQDYPRYRWRGFMVDSGRAPNSLPKLKRIIRICSAFKLNLLVFREGDDELNAVRYRTNPLGSTNPHALSMEQVQDLIDYAWRHNITVVPEIESLGHSQAKSVHYPDLVSGGIETRYDPVGVHIRKSHLNPDDPRTYQLLESIYGEWFPLLKGPLVHLGLDEVRLPREIQARHFERLLGVVDRVAERCGRPITPIVWGDAPLTPVGYQDRVIRCLWSYGAQGEINLSNEHLQSQGLEGLSREHSRETVFMAGGSDSYHDPYSKLDCERAFANLAAWSCWGSRRTNFSGLLGVQWGGNMLDDWLPDFLAVADWGWSPPSGPVAVADEIARIQQHLQHIPDAVNPRPEEIDPPAWDGIWLRGRTWDRDIVPSPG